MQCCSFEDGGRGRELRKMDRLYSWTRQGAYFLECLVFSYPCQGNLWEVSLILYFLFVQSLKIEQSWKTEISFQDLSWTSRQHCTCAAFSVPMRMVEFFKAFPLVVWILPFSFKVLTGTICPHWSRRPAAAVLAGAGCCFQHCSGVGFPCRLALPPPPGEPESVRQQQCPVETLSWNLQVGRKHWVVGALNCKRGQNTPLAIRQLASFWQLREWTRRGRGNECHRSCVSH